MKKLGTVPIPSLSMGGQYNKAVTARKILSELTPGKADLYEFESQKEAANMRSMLHTMATLKWGNGHISTRLIENTLYVWYKENGNEE